MGSCYVFHLQLENIAPTIWRRLEVRCEKTFWDLHCAIQDAMPWEDRHLHDFRFSTGDQAVQIGLPDLDYSESDELASWETRLKDWFITAPASCSYIYDFGDDWHHTITLEAIKPAEKGGRYPRCVAGERRCPPEDVGGPYGYQQFLEALASPNHPDHSMYRDWIHQPWDPELFHPDEVRFSSPAARLRYAGLG